MTGAAPARSDNNAQCRLTRWANQAAVRQTQLNLVTSSISSGVFRMDQQVTYALGAPASRALAHALAGYRAPNSARSTFEIAITAIPFVLIWVAMWAGLAQGYWICLALALPAAGFLVRLFMIQ